MSFLQPLTRGPVRRVLGPVEVFRLGSPLSLLTRWDPMNLDVPPGLPRPVILEILGVLPSLEMHESVIPPLALSPYECRRMHRELLELKMTLETLSFGIARKFIRPMSAYRLVPFAMLLWHMRKCCVLSWPRQMLDPSAFLTVDMSLRFAGDRSNFLSARPRDVRFPGAPTLNSRGILSLFPRCLPVLKTSTAGRLVRPSFVGGTFLESTVKLLLGSIVTFLPLAAPLPQGALPILANAIGLCATDRPRRLPLRNYI